MQREWTVQTPKMQSPQDFYIQSGQSQEGDPEYVFKCVDGKCVFLDQDNLCVMHREWGFTQKASNCMQYPFTFTEAPDGIRVGLLFSCEGVAQSHPETTPLPIEEAAQIFSVANHVDKIGETLLLTQHQEISFSEYLSLEKLYFQFLEASPIEDALIAYGLLLDHYVLTQQIVKDPWAILEQAKSYQGRPRSQRSFLITFITLLDSMMHGSKSLGLSRLIRNQFKAWCNRGTIFVQNLGAISLQGLEEIPFPPSEEERLRTFLIQLVWRRRLLPRLSIHRGFRVLCLYYGLIRFLSRGIAQIQKQSTISTEILLQAIDLLERYYLSHNKFTQAFEPHSTLSRFLNPIFLNASFVPIFIRSR